MPPVFDRMANCRASTEIYCKRHSFLGLPPSQRLGFQRTILRALLGTLHAKSRSVRKRNNAMTATTKMKELIMFKKSDYLTSALLAASLMCVAPLARADHEKSAAKEQCSANEFIGKK